MCIVQFSVAAVCPVQCYCVCSAGAEMVQCNADVCAVQVLKWCSVVQVDCMGYMGHMGLCVISVKKC